MPAAEVDEILHKCCVHFHQNQNTSIPFMHISKVARLTQKLTTFIQNIGNKQRTQSHIPERLVYCIINTRVEERWVNVAGIINKH
jgi:hypothetical protein